MTELMTKLDTKELELKASAISLFEESKKSAVRNEKDEKEVREKIGVLEAIIKRFDELSGIGNQRFNSEVSRVLNYARSAKNYFSLSVKIFGDANFADEVRQKELEQRRKEKAELLRKNIEESNERQKGRNARQAIQDVEKLVALEETKAELLRKKAEESKENMKKGRTGKAEVE